MSKAVPESIDLAMRQAEQMRERLDQTLHRVEDRSREVSYRIQAPVRFVRRHPFGVMGVLMIVGFAVGALLPVTRKP